ncbi:unnamed protein product [Lepeophtheirus salmonis]|uniref:(salmon louse) hypothetical protein n=2 Tax=Lepeophtheirus salmonis TaxID=72036 RepID=A0A7R8CS61_LEPSM|nr:unnamed protein product [Lepeophtheirus salmonis]CAF2876637.1 unnamed protein product [Lepeophtheirus salmonis]
MDVLNEEYLLQWKSHNTEIIQEFHRLYKDDRFTDCTIAAEDETFRAHKLILSGCSPYFKSLFEKTSCSSPVIVLKDISAEHVGLLIRYMYLGVISVKREDLTTILRTANSLRIRGLTTDMSEESAVAHQLDGQTATIHPTAPPSPPLVKEGRKGYVPKKLRAHPSSSAGGGGDNDSIVSSPRASSSEGPVEPEPSGVSPDNGSDSPEGSKGGSVDEEQPWNLSQGKESGITIGKAKFPILGNYLKNGNSAQINGGNASKKIRTGSIDELLETIRMNNGNHHHINNNTISSNNNEQRNSEEITSNSSPVMSSQSLAQSWLDQLSLVKEEHHKSNKENPGSNSTMSLSEAHGLAGIDIAERIRAMTAPFSQTYGNLLNNVSTNSIAQLNNNTNGDTPPPPSFTSSPVPRSSGDLGEIGPNGKPSVTCEVCGKKLADPSSLYRHRKIHSGDKPHKCPFCSRRFIQRYNMKQHMKTHRIDRIDNPELAAAIAAGDYSIPRKAKNI